MMSMEKFLNEQGIVELVDNMKLVSTEYSGTAVSVAANMIGTRVHQDSYTIDQSLGPVISCFISHVSYSSRYIPVCFIANGVLWLNIYSATSGSYSIAAGDVKATVVQCKGVVKSQSQ